MAAIASGRLQSTIENVSQLISITNNFEQLANLSPHFRIWKGTRDGEVDFKDPEALKQLSASIAQVDFGLELEFLDDRLCPPIPIRFRYILWIRDLLHTTQEGSGPSGKVLDEVIGIDVGTGASCIYPLLGCATFLKWKFVATEIDKKSVDCAKRNISSNFLSKRIYLVKTDPDAPLFKLREFEIMRNLTSKSEHVDFTMCNPPFYRSHDHMTSGYDTKDMAPSSACTGSAAEMICDGGEVGFITRMIDESLVLKEKVHWYTSMVGLKGSLESIVTQFREKRIPNWIVTNLSDDSTKTKRYAVGWSFGTRRATDCDTRGLIPGSWELWRPSGIIGSYPLIQHEFLQSDRESVITRINSLLSQLEASWNWEVGKNVGVLTAEKPAWTRQFRRKRKREVEISGAVHSGKDETHAHKSQDQQGPNHKKNQRRRERQKAKAAQKSLEKTQPPSMVGEISVMGVKIEVMKDKVVLKWIKGHKHKTFEDFCTWFIAWVLGPYKEKEW